MENLSENHNLDSEKPNFEVDSIELATPELFSDVNQNDELNQDNDSKELEIFENSRKKLAH